MGNAELSLRFSSNTEVNVSFDSTESGTLPFANPVTKKDRDDIKWYIETYGSASLADPDDQEAKRIEARLPEIGKALFRAVFDDRAAQRALNRFQDADSQQRVLTINSQDASILSLPWELLHDPTGVFLFREKPHISVRRKISGATGGREPFRVESKDRLHLLFVVSRPKDGGFIDPRADPQAVLYALEEHAPGRVTCEFLRPATLNALVERLDDDTKPAIDILHFDGHGVFRQISEEDAEKEPGLYGKSVLSEIQRERQSRKEDTSDKPVGIGFLLFEKEEDRTNHLVSAADLGDNLFQSKVGLVVLSACQTAMLDDESGDPMASVAGKLTTTGIPAILAMTHSVLVATTRMLFGKFYESLARGRGIATALDDARTYLANNPEKYEVQRGEQRKKLELRDWFLPALFHGGSDSPLLTAQQADPDSTTATKQSNLREAHEAGFFGRRRELWDIECWFATDETRRISIAGFGGQGKTELALEAGRWLMRAGMFENAVFVDYAQVQSEDALSVAVSTIGTVLEESLINAEAASQALAKTPNLVILDNLETVSAEALRELLDAAVVWSNAGDSRVLLTSRLPDFNHPDYRTEGTRKHRRIALEGLGSARAPDDALAWFGELSKLPPAPSVPAPKRDDLIELFDRVRFHPLSISVLAQQLKTRTAKSLGKRLEAILHEEAPAGLVAEGMPHSLIASLQLSLERLSEEERHAVRRLGIFQGGAFEDNLLAITELGESDKDSSAQYLWPSLRRQLEAVALIEAEAIPGVSPPFIRFHPTLAPMLWAQLAVEEQTQLTEAHRKRFYALAGYLYNEDSKNSHQVRAIALRELPNLLYAVHQALDADDPDGVDFVNSINRFLTAFGMTREAASLIRRAEKFSGEKGSRAWYLAQTSRGEQLRTSGQIGQAAEIFSDILQTIGDKPSYELALTLGRLGRCYGAGGRPDLAEAQYRQGIAVTEKLDQSDQVKQHRGTLYTDLADVLADQGKFAEAREEYEATLKIDKELNDIRNQGATLAQLGTLAMREGNLPEAVERYQEAFKLFQRLNEPTSEAVIQHQLGRVFQEEGQWDQAEQHYREAASLHEKQGNLAGAAQTWNQLATVSQRRGKLEAAEMWYRKAIVGMQNPPSGDRGARCFNNLAILLQNQPGRLAEARQLAEEGLAIDKTLDPGAAEIWKTYNLLAQIADKESQPDKATEYRHLAREAKRNFAGTAHEMGCDPQK